MSKETKVIEDNNEEPEIQLESISNEELLAQATGSEIGDDVQEETTDEHQEDVEEEIVPEVVQKAKKNGHLSQEDYQKKYGSLKGYKSPEEFNKFGEIYPEIKDALKGINKKLEQRDKELEASLKYIERVREREQAAARQELVAALKQAHEMGDVDAVRHLTKEEAKLDYQEAQQAAQAAAQQVNQVVESFQSRNPWYNKDPEMTNRAIQIDNEIRSGKYSHIMPQPQNYEQLGRQIEIIIQQEFGDRVGASSSTRQAPMINNARSSLNKTQSETSSSRTFKSLPEDLKSIYQATKRMLQNNGMEYTEQEFIKKLQKDGEI